MRRHISDLAGRIVLIFCLVLSVLILFVLFGGARFLYSLLLPHYDFSELSPFPHQDQVGRILTSPFQASDDFRAEAFLYRLYTEKTNSSYSHMQGACTDGTWIWFGWSNPTMIMKVHVLTHEVQVFRYSEENWPFGHINDLTYNPETDELLVCSYVSDRPETYGNLSILDANSLELKETIVLEQNDGQLLAFHGIAFDRVHRQYIVAESRALYTVLDLDFQVVRDITASRYEHDTLQGIETDGTFLYRALWKDYDRNRIAVYDLDGNFIRLIEVPISGNDTELQDIMYDWQGNWFINTADYDRENALAGCSLYYTGLLSTVDYTQVEQFFSLLEALFSSTS